MDIALGPFVTSLTRRKAADFTIPIRIADQIILLPRPTLQSDPLGFLKPFTFNVRTLKHYLFLIWVTSWFIILKN